MMTYGSYVKQLQPIFLILFSNRPAASWQKLRNMQAYSGLLQQFMFTASLIKQEKSNWGKWFPKWGVGPS